MPATPETKTIVRLANDLIWMYEHWEELCKSNPRQVVGVARGQVVAVAESFGRLNAKLKNLGLRPAEVAKAYIYPDPDYLKNFLPQREQYIEGLRNGDISP